MNFTTPTQRCFVNAPFDKLADGLLDLFVDQGLQPEIGLEGEALYRRSASEFQEVAETLRSNNLHCTLHAPFFDLAAGALDPGILAASRDKLRRAFALIPIFKPQTIVCHLGYEENKHGYKHEQWFCAARQTWQELLTIAETNHTVLALENTYEKKPTEHRHMLETLDSSYAQFCLDVGHLLAFAQSPWQEWLPIMNPWLSHLHLHDNTGEKDSHLGIGLGNFDFTGLFTYLAANSVSPSITIEPHSEEDLLTSLDALRVMGVASLGK